MSHKGENTVDTALLFEGLSQIGLTLAPWASGSLTRRLERKYGSRTIAALLSGNEPACEVPPALLGICRTLRRHCR